MIYFLQRQRKTTGKYLHTVFDFMSDGTQFRFAKPDRHKYLLLSKVFVAPGENDDIYAGIDAVLLAAAYSSPHTTRVSSAKRLRDHSEPIPAVERFLGVLTAE